jgi:hypothetical protein
MPLLCTTLLWVQPASELPVLPHTNFTPVQDPRTAFNAAAGSTLAAVTDNSADVWEAARTAHESLLSTSPTQLDTAMPDDLALQVRLVYCSTANMVHVSLCEHAC